MWRGGGGRDLTYVPLLLLLLWPWIGGREGVQAMEESFLVSCPLAVPPMAPPTAVTPAHADTPPCLLAVSCSLCPLPP